jgi:aminoglycoside phosphotransferase (APT) family kinase protein
MSATADALDATAVTRWIETLGLGARAPLTFARIGDGRSNLIYGVSDADGRRWVLRRPPLGRLLPRAHDVAREHRIMAALEPTDVPTPAVLGLCRDPQVSDVPLLLLEHVDGIVLDRDEVAEAASPSWRGRAGAALVDALVKVHAVDLEQTGLVELASHAPYAERQLRRWREQWERSRTREAPAVDELADRLQAAIPQQREVTLVHGDVHLRNVILDPAGGAVRALLDWELCTLGDPLADVGTLLAYWPQADDVPRVPRGVSSLPGFASRAELLDAYVRATGRDAEAVPFWHALALWKVAVILEGVARRALEDPRNPAGEGTLQVVDDLLERARQVAVAAGI